MQQRVEQVAAEDGAGTFDLSVWVPDRGSGPGLLLIQEIYGVSDYIRAVAERPGRSGLRGGRARPVLADQAAPPGRARPGRAGRVAGAGPAVRRRAGRPGLPGRAARAGRAARGGRRPRGDRVLPGRLDRLPGRRAGPGGRADLVLRLGRAGQPRPAQPRSARRCSSTSAAATRTSRGTGSAPWRKRPPGTRTWRCTSRKTRGTRSTTGRPRCSTRPSRPPGPGSRPRSSSAGTSRYAAGVSYRLAYRPGRWATMRRICSP